MTQPPAPGPAAAPRPSLRSVALKVLLHGAFLLVSIGCLALYEHFRVEGASSASIACLVAGAVFGFAPGRDLVRIVFRVEGKALHLVHGLGGLALLALPLTGVIPGAPVLTHAAMAPFEIMGAAQAVMHQGHPRNAKQAAALQRFATSLPEVAQFAGSKDLASPGNAMRAVAVLSDIIGKAKALGATELDSDPGFQSALSRASTRFGANLGLDAVEMVLAKLAANPATAGAVPKLRRQLGLARSSIAGVRNPHAEVRHARTTR
jgi:hypothetical protein